MSLCDWPNMMMSSCDSCCGASIHAPLAADVLSWLSDSLAEPGEALTCGTKDMTAVNAAQHGLHELVTAVGGGGSSSTGGGASLRLPLMQPSGHHTHAHAVFMYSTAADGNVTLQLRDACTGGDDCTGATTGVGGSSASGVSAAAGADGVTTLSISYQDIATDLLGDAAASIDVLLGTAPPTPTMCTATLHAATGGDDSGGPGGGSINETSATTVLDLFDSSSGGHDLTLSPQTFTSSAEAFINDNSDSLGVPQDSVDTVCTTEELKKSVSVTTSDVTKLTVKRARPKAASPNRQGPQQCQVCSKVFGNASALAKHKLTHSDERKYVCSMCGKAFKRQDHLNGHMLTHRNKKPYECKADGCGKSYCDARSLRRHTENHHSGGAAVGGVGNNGAGAVAALAGTGGSGSGGGALVGAAAVVSTSTLSPAQGAASGDAASPHGSASSTCIQYAPPPTNGSTDLKNGSENGLTGTKTGSSTGKSQLQQLLASEPASKNGSNTPNNDGLTKQQLDLIHQIMEQTQRQSQQISAAAANNGASNKTSGSSARASSTAKPKLSRTWSAPVQTSGGTSKSGVGSNGSSASSTSGGHGRSSVSGSGVGGASSGAQGSGSAAVVVTPKPVECNLCHRKFKNIPALNGHMRLHGGYFKKDAENKKCEKKESTGPPLQTASVSVRALIEEKIISKRTTNPQNITVTSSTASAPTTPTADSTRTNAPPLYPLTSGSDTSKVTSFVVPAPPNHTVTASTEKIRRHSDTEKFTIPRTPNSSVSSVAVTAQQEAEALADLILKRGAKVVKRTTSDPGGQTQQQLQIQFQQASDAFALAGVTYQSDDGSGYFSPSLQDDVFHQVQDTMLLQGVDATQLAESIQLQAASLLQDQSADQQLQDIASLEDYASVTASLQESVNSPSYGGPHTVNHELQAVLDSPLPESLAEFSAYHPSDATANSTSTADDSASPLQRFAASSASPRTGSPLVRHDSPGFAYPTPPASHEGQSPGGGYSGAHLLPMLSPQTVGDGQNNNAFARTTDLEEPPQASSPLSAAFYTSTMSSAAAVEEALEEVLPGETIAPDDMYPSLTNSPPPAPQSPLSVGMTPVPSPNVPASPTMVNSPAHVAFPLSSPHHYAALQSQMMPNSEDPLLSSSPKDFATRKRFEFNSGNIQSFRIISTSGNDASSGGLIELPPGSATAFSGILVDSNGELKFIQAAPGAFHNAKNIVVTSTGALSPLGPTTNGNSQAPTVVQIVEAAPSQLQQSVSSAHALRTVTVSPHHTHHQQNQILQPHRTHHLQRLGSRAVQCTVPGKPNVTPRPKLHIAVDNLKQEEADDVFLSPTMIPASPIRASRKRPRSEPTLTVPIVHQSRLRAAKGRPPGAAPYTPAPMLNPSRPGPGLYAHAKWKASSPSMSTSNCSRNTTSSTGRKFGNSNSNTNPERRNCSSPVDSSTPESDSTPHINVGCQYQCSYIPDAVLGRGSNTKDDREPNYEHLLWDPCITTTCTDAEVEMYLEFACCAAVPGGGRNKEYALHLLHMCSGNIHDAMLKLMQPTPSLPPDHPLLAYQYCESDKWSTQETEAFHRALLKHNKDFSSVSRDIGTKNVKQCVQFYYVWKKVCSDEYRRMRGTLTPSSRDTPPLRDTTDAFDMKLLGMVDAEPPLVQAPLTHTMDLPRTFTCEYADCSASFNSRAALNGHIRIHGGTVRRSPTPGPQQQQNSIGGVMGNSAISHQQHGGDIASRRQSQQHHHQTDEEFPCKVCGKVFTKIKSRSAHMKSHRPPDAEPKRAAKGDAPCSSPYDASMSPATPNAVHSPLLGSQ